MNPIPICETLPNPLPFLIAANALTDDAAVAAWQRRGTAAVDAERRARQLYNAAAGAGAYPRSELATLKAQLDQVRGARKALAASQATEAAGLLARSQLQVSETLAGYLSRPDDADPTADVLELQEERRRLAAMDAAKRAIVVRSAAEAGEHRLTLRAALAPPRAGEDPLLPEEIAAEARAWVVTRRAPAVVRQLRTAQRLRQLAQKLEVAEYELAVE